MDGNAGEVAESSGGGVAGSLNLYTGHFGTGKTARLPLSSEYHSFINRPHTASTLLLYPDGSGEITGCHTGGGVGCEKNPTSEFEKFERSCRRARKNVRQLVRYNACRYLWTATKRGGMPDYRTALRIHKRFVREVQKTYPDFGALFIRELHKGGGVNDGTFHLHFTVAEFYDVAVLRAAWYRVCGFNDEGKPNGQVNVQSPPGAVWNPSKISNYICKYMLKDLEPWEKIKFEHWYWMTKNFRIPDLSKNSALRHGRRVLVDYSGTIKDREARLLGLLFFLTGKKVVVSWRSEDGRDFRISTVEVVDHGPG